MLRELRISNFIIIEEQAISLGEGFNAISGESGAGKSVVLQAIEFVLGRRANANMLRSEEKTAEVQALFDLTDLPESLTRELPDSVRENESKELLITRSLAAGGKGKVHINGRLGTVSLLQELGRVLVTVSSQREYMRLLDGAYHLTLLDSFGNHEPLLARYRPLYERWAGLKAELAELEERLTKSVFRRAELESMVEELGPVKLRPGLRADLENEVKKVGAGELLSQSGDEITALLRDGEGPVIALRVVSTKLHDLAKHDPALNELAQRASSLRTEVDELGSDLSRYLSRLELDENKLGRLREELAEVARLERKYRAPDAALCELLSRAREELSVIDDPSVIENKRKEFVLAEAQLGEAARELSGTRARAAKKLIRALEQELRELGMPDAHLGFKQETVPFSAGGADKIELLIAVNKGSELRPIGTVASGGELSRFFLGCKKTMGESNGTPVLVFDEVDTGVSGKTARAVGEKLKSLADEAQVLCITHLPQVASLADHHFTVEKRRGKVTSSVIRELSHAEKIDEIARMLAGYEITAAARESARELLASKPIE